MLDYHSQRRSDGDPAVHPGGDAAAPLLHVRILRFSIRWRQPFDLVADLLLLVTDLDISLPSLHQHEGVDERPILRLFQKSHRRLVSQLARLQSLLHELTACLRRFGPLVCGVRELYNREDEWVPRLVLLGEHRCGLCHRRQEFLSRDLIVIRLRAVDQVISELIRVSGLRLILRIMTCDPMAGSNFDDLDEGVLNYHWSCGHLMVPFRRQKLL